MFQRTILRQAQAASSLLSVRSTSSAPSALRRTSQFQPQSLRPLAPLPGLRNYSTENKAEEGKQEKNENAESESQNPEDAVRKELEKKEKEVVDLKVSYQ